MVRSATLRAAAIAVAMAASVIPNPAMAQFFDDDHDRGFQILVPCIWTHPSLRREIAEQGYSEIYLNVPNNNRIQVRATKGDWIYLLQVRTCDGRILDRERWRRR